MSAPPKVSLVMPSYRRGPKIARALGSVLRQTRPPDEVLVVNDGGYPATAGWVTAHYPAVRLLNVEHGGAARARNRGVEAAAGEVVVLFDDDDEMLPHAVETLLAVLQEFPEARAAHCDATFTNLVTGEHHDNHHLGLKPFHRLRQVRPLRQTARARLYGKALYYSLLWGNLLQQPWAVYRATYLRLGGFRPGLGSCDDWDLYLRMSRAVPVAVSDEVIARHYVEGGKPHLTLAANQEEGMVRVMRGELAASPWHDLRARLVLRRRLAVLHKSAGDRARPGSPRDAWLAYLRSFRSWPLDHVVAARALWWGCRLALRRS
jgi:glycosyltransferase involved in cell wall biosynthesis